MKLNLKNNEIKYLHIMTHPSNFFNDNIIKMINDPENNFIKTEHTFIVSDEKLYKKHKEEGNIIWIKNIMTSNFYEFIKYGKKSRYIFLHQNWYFDFIRLIFTPLKIRKKYIWCVWGHDLYTNIGKSSGVKQILISSLRSLGQMLISLEVKLYKGIGIGFKYDSLEIKRRFGGRCAIYICPYLSGIDLQEVKQIDKNLSLKKKKCTTNIMIGHSAHPYLNHKKILEKLKRYKDEDIKIILTFAYGNIKYAKMIEEYAKNIFNEDKVEILRNRMTISQYIKYLKSVDIAIFDQLHQSGLANIYYLLYLGKKIYLNKDGMLRQAFILEGSYLNYVDEIDNLSFKEFKEENIDNKNAKEYIKCLLDEKNCARMWEKTLEELNKNAN